MPPACLRPTAAAFRGWSTLIWLAAAAQAALLLACWGRAQPSPGLLAAFGAALAVLAVASRYRWRASRAPTPSGMWTVIGQLLVSTWVAAIGATTFAFRAAGISMLVILLDSDPSNDLKPGQRALATALFAACAVSLVNDAATVSHHTRHHRAAAAAAAGVGGGGALGSAAARDRVHAAIAVAADVALVVACAAAFGVHGNAAGGVSVLVVLAASLACEAQHYRAAARGGHADASEWHVVSALLALQHALATSAAFLVTLPLLLCASIGVSAATVAGALGSGGAALLAALLLAYGVAAVAAVVLVALHSQLEVGGGLDGAAGGGGFDVGGGGASPRAEAYTALRAGAPGDAGGCVPAAVPVAIVPGVLAAAVPLEYGVQEHRHGGGGGGGGGEDDPYGGPF